MICFKHECSNARQRKLNPHRDHDQSHEARDRIVHEAATAPSKIWACQFLGNPAALMLASQYPKYTVATRLTRLSSFRKSPQARAPAVHLGGFKLILGQIIGQTELLIFLILGWGTNKDLAS